MIKSETKNGAALQICPFIYFINNVQKNTLVGSLFSSFTLLLFFGIGN